MPHRQKHRGQQSNDPMWFGNDWLVIINEAVEDFSYLLTRGYSDKSSLKIVGDRYKLHRRQRQALLRASCSDHAKETRPKKNFLPDQIHGKQIAIDAYNLLIFVESVLGGGIAISCRDGCFRDIASIHGTYRRVEETLPALLLIGNVVQKLHPKSIQWFLDAPVSNSGRLKGYMDEVAVKNQFLWKISLANNPDRILINNEDWVVVSSDGWVIDRSKYWFNMHRRIVEQIPTANVIHLEGKT